MEGRIQVKFLLLVKLIFIYEKSRAQHPPFSIAVTSMHITCNCKRDQFINSRTYIKKKQIKKNKLKNQGTVIKYNSLNLTVYFKPSSKPMSISLNIEVKPLRH